MAFLMMDSISQMRLYVLRRLHLFLPCRRGYPGSRDIYRFKMLRKNLLPS
jgi:hypothetical protein